MNNDLSMVISKVVSNLDRDVITSKPKSVIILYKNQQLKVRSGKTSWGTIGAAKNAFNNHIDNEIRLARYNKLDITKKQVVDELVKLGLLEFKVL